MPADKKNTCLLINVLKKSKICMLVLFFNIFFLTSIAGVLVIDSLAVHPDKIRIASGQVAGHERKEGKVR